MDYRKIWGEAYGPIPRDEKGRSFEIHHIDGNRKNNSLENLKCVSIEEYYRIHQKQKDQAACHAILLRMSGKSLKGWHHTEQIKQKFSKDRKGRKHSAQTKEKMSDTRKGKKHSTETKTKLSEINRHPILHIESKIAFESGKMAATILKVSPSTVLNRVKKGEFRYITVEEYVKNQNKNKTLPFRKYRGGDTQKKKVKHIKTEKVFQSVAEAAKAFSIAPSNMSYYVKKGFFKYL